MRILTSLLFMLASIIPGTALAEAQVLTLWPEKFLGGNIQPDEFVKKNNSVAYRSVSSPSMEVFLPPAEKSNGAAVLVCPGGAYSQLAYTHEGTEIAQWLAGQGVAGIVLRYRIPRASSADACRCKTPSAHSA